MKQIISLLVGAAFLLGLGQFQGSITLTPSAYASKKAEEPDPDAPPPEFEYLQFEPLSLPVITSKGLVQHVSLMVLLEVDYGQKEEISLYKPRLIDAYIQDLYGALGTGDILMHGNFVDVKQVKQRLSSVTNEVLGPADIKVRDVLLQVLRQRKM